MGNLDNTSRRSFPIVRVHGRDRFSATVFFMEALLACEPMSARAIKAIFDAPL